MALPKNFVFSQANLQDFVECRRRFYLHYIQKLRWPAIQSEPFLENERYLLQGEIFHRSAHQYFLGVNKERIAEAFTEEEQIKWWQNFTAFIEDSSGIADENVKKYPEFILTARISDYRLVAKFDLVCFFPDGKLGIYDWKTNRAKPARKWFANRMQTLVYPFVLTQAGKGLQADQPVVPDKIELVYWFSVHPQDTLVFPYSKNEFSRTQKTLLDLVSLIARLAESNREQDFPKTEEIKKCAFCVYRSLCNTGIKAGIQRDEFPEEELEAIEFDFDQITELMIG